MEAANVFFVWEMLRPLLAGQILCVVPDDVIYDAEALSLHLEKHKVTRMLFTPLRLSQQTQSVSFTGLYDCVLSGIRWREGGGDHDKNVGTIGRFF